MQQQQSSTSNQQQLPQQFYTPIGANNAMHLQKQPPNYSLNPQFYNSAGGTPYQNQQVLQQMQLQNMYLHQQPHPQQLLHNSGGAGPMQQAYYNGQRQQYLSQSIDQSFMTDANNMINALMYQQQQYGQN